jgi:hypothetical protein
LKAFPPALNGIEFFQGLLLHRQIGLQVNMGRFDAFMTQPQGNGGDINPSLKQMRGGRMAYDMRRNVFGGEARTNGRGTPNGLF